MDTQKSGPFKTLSAGNENSFAQKTFALLVPGAVGAIIGLVFFYTGWLGYPFTQKAEFAVWVSINLILFILTAIFLAAGWKWVRVNQQFFGSNFPELAVSILLTTFFFFIPVIMSSNMQPANVIPLPNAALKTTFLVVFGYLITLVPVCICLWGIQNAMRSIHVQEPPTNQVIERFIQYRDILNQLLAFVGILLSLFILASGELREILIRYDPADAKNYPPEALLVAGGFYTLVIAMLFFPPYLSLASLGRKMVDACFCLPEPDASDWETIYKKRALLEDHLELNVSAEQRFVRTLTFAAPLVSSIFSTIVTNSKV